MFLTSPRNPQGQGLRATTRMNRAGKLKVKRTDRQQVEAFLRSAAEAGNPRAMTLFAFVRAAKKDPAGAQQWFRRAVDAGDMLGLALFGQAIAAKEPRRAEKLIIKAAEAGCAEAMHMLAMAYRQGLLGKPRPDRYRHWLQKVRI